MSKRAIVFLLAGIIALGGAAAAAEQVTIRDYVGVAWKDELVHEELTFAPGEYIGRPQATVIDPSGKAIPAQVENVQLHDDLSVRSMEVWFLASVAPEGESTYTIHAGKAQPDFEGLDVRETGDTIEFVTETPDATGICLIGRSKEYVWPIPAADAPGPIVDLLLPSGRRAGMGRFEVHSRSSCTRQTSLPAGRYSPRLASATSSTSASGSSPRGSFAAAR